MNKYVFIAAAFLLALFSCNETAPPDHAIRLRWVKAYPAETWSDVQTGLLWSLSYMGARLDTSNAKNLVERIDSSRFVLHLDKAGFSESALRSLHVICDSLRESGEYEKMNGIDLGRFLLLTEHTSLHYYRLTDAAPTLQDFYKRHDFTNAKTFNVEHSGVAEHFRVLHFTVGADYRSIAWVAEEGEGDVEAGTFRTEVYEVLDLMPNGQLRFAIYDVNGNLISASPVHLGKAGKPSKCLWCHELVVQPLFFETRQLSTGISIKEFGAWVDSAQHIIDRYRATLPGLIDFQQKQAHTKGELLYVSFMEPGVYRLANEWQLSPAEVQRKMNGEATHKYDEFTFLGDCYHRYCTDSLAPYLPKQVPRSVREPNATEPFYFKNEK